MTTGDPGYWIAWLDAYGAVVLGSDGPAEAKMHLSGDFATVADALAYARHIARVLNGETSPA